MEVVQAILNGVLLGGVYAVAALGLSLIYGVSRVLNLAHGDFIMLGAVLTMAIFNVTSIVPYFILVVLVPLFMVIGAAIFLGLIHRATVKPPEQAISAVILATLGLSLVIEDATAYTVGVQSNISYYVVRYSLPPISIGNFTIPFSTTRIISLLCALFLGTALHFFLIKTETGRTIRAIMQDRELCLMLGINEKKISALSFAIGITLAGMGGLFLILITGFTAYVGQYYTVKALSMIVLGGMGSLLGSVIGSILIGITESLTAYYLGPLWMPAISIIVLFVILVIRPQGIVGQRG